MSLCRYAPAVRVWLLAAPGARRCARGGMRATVFSRSRGGKESDSCGAQRATAKRGSANPLVVDEDAEQDRAATGEDGSHKGERPR